MRWCQAIWGQNQNLKWKKGLLNFRTSPTLSHKIISRYWSWCCDDDDDDGDDDGNGDDADLLMHSYPQKQLNTFNKLATAVHETLKNSRETLEGDPGKWMIYKHVAMVPFFVFGEQLPDFCCSHTFLILWLTTWSLRPILAMEGSSEYLSQ